jgi:hypothetical protein
MIWKVLSCMHFSAHVDAVAVETVAPLLPKPPTKLHVRCCLLEGMEVSTPAVPLFCEICYIPYYLFCSTSSSQYTTEMLSNSLPLHILVNERDSIALILLYILHTEYTE